MRAKKLGETLNRRGLARLIHPLRYLDNHTNLFYLAADYATLAAVIVPTAAFCHLRGEWGLSRWWCVPVLAVAVVLIGAIQHRFAGLAHEGAHYILLKNRFWNELVSDWFCMFPLFSTTAQYRLIHLGHHEYTNDWRRDPELLNMGETRMMDRFPMVRGEFLRRFVGGMFSPARLLRYMWDNIYITTLGNSINPYQPRGGGRGWIGKFRVTTVLGMAWIVPMVATMGYLSYFGDWRSLLLAPVAFWSGAAVVVALLPEEWFFRSQLRSVISSKTTSLLRLGWITLLECAAAWLRYGTGTDWGVYFWLLWVLPMFTSFPYFMLLRDLFQHANADDGKLTNSRVILCNPALRWAMFIYGQDLHLPHHLYPAVPHYNLRRLHRLLVEHSHEYAEHVVVCHGVLWNRSGNVTAIDCMELPSGGALAYAKQGH